jgi:hypothetical protein
MEIADVSLFNPAGQYKPQQGITPTDYRQNRKVVVRTRVPVSSLKDWLAPDDKLEISAGRTAREVPAGGVRIIDLK